MGENKTFAIDAGKIIDVNRVTGLSSKKQLTLLDTKVLRWANPKRKTNKQVKCYLYSTFYIKSFKYKGSLGKVTVLVFQLQV